MRDCLRNQTQFWYALYTGKEEVEKDGKKTGQYKAIYAAPVIARAAISPSTGAAEQELFGSAVSYDRIISTVQKLPIDEYSKIWIDVEPTDSSSPEEYRVIRRAMGLNQNLWAIKKVVRE